MSWISGGVTSVGTTVPAQACSHEYTFGFDGGGNPIPDESTIYLIVPVGGRLDKFLVQGTLALGEPSSSATIDIWREDFAGGALPDLADSICGANKIVMGSATFKEASLAGWNRTVVSGDILAINLSNLTGFGTLGGSFLISGVTPDYQPAPTTAIFSGGGNPIPDGSALTLPVPEDRVVKAVWILGDQSGAATVDIQVAAFGTEPDSSDSICGGSPAATSTQFEHITDVSGWSTVIPKNSTMRVELSGMSNFTLLTVVIQYE